MGRGGDKILRGARKEARERSQLRLELLAKIRGVEELVASLTRVILDFQQRNADGQRVIETLRISITEKQVEIKTLREKL